MDALMSQCHGWQRATCTPIHLIILESYFLVFNTKDINTFDVHECTNALMSTRAMDGVGNEIPFYSLIQYCVRDVHGCTSVDVVHG